MGLKRLRHSPKHRALALLMSLILVGSYIIISPVLASACEEEWVNVSVSGSYVNAIAVSPRFATDNTIFIGNTWGVYKSDNWGGNWTHIFDGNMVHTIAMPKTFCQGGDTGTIFAGSYGAIYKSINKGDSWSQVETGAVSAVAVSPNYAVDRTVFYGGYAGIYKSADEGQSWTQVSTESARGLAVSPAYSSDHTVYAATDSGMFKSTDSGQSWSQAGSVSGYMQAIAVTPNFNETSATGTIFMATSTGIYKSTDRAQTWSKLSNLNADSLVVTPSYASDKTIFAGSSSGVYKSTNAGGCWYQVYGSYFKSLAVSPNYAVDHAVFAGTNFGIAFYTSLDIFPPEVAYTSPCNGEDNVPVDKAITIKFNEDIHPGAAYQYILVKDAAGNPIPIEKSIECNKLTINALNNLDRASEYTVVIPAAAVMDWNNNSLKEQSVFSFRTQAQAQNDETYPCITRTEPCQNARNVSTKNPVITVEFSEDVKAGSAFNKVRIVGAGNKLTATRKVVQGNKLMIIPSKRLAAKKNYVVVVPAGAVEDISGNDLASQKTFNFKTARK